jgi:hypothetical protein
VTWLYIIARSRLGQALAGIAAALVWLGLRDRKQRQAGAQAATEAAREKDSNRAREIENAADAARRAGGDVDDVERLHRSGRIRDY